MTEREQVEELHQKYLSLRENTPEVKRNGEECKAYHKWYDNAYVYFKSFEKLHSDPDFQTFVNAEKDGNCFVLAHIYDSISPSYKVLLAKTARMNELVNDTSESKPNKVFISHASVDKSIIDAFVDNVLVLGLGLKKEDIAYTSNEVYGVAPGDDISRYIKDNIADATVVLLMISSAYKQSEVCLNEMGAAWALNKSFISVLLPETGYDKLGWLTNLQKAVKINQKDHVMSLCQKIVKLTKSVDINERLTDIVSYTDKFIGSLPNNPETPQTIETKHFEVGNINDVVNRAINELGEFTIKELQDATMIKNYRFLVEKINAMVAHGDLIAFGSATHKKYKIKV